MAAGPMTTMKSAGRMQKINGKRIFTGTFCAISSARWLRFTRRSLGLHAQHVRDRDTEGVGLHHRRDEPAQFRDVRSLGDSAQRVDSGQADLHLLEHSKQLFGQRTSGVAGDLRQRRVERQAGLDRDRQQVHRVRQVAADPLAAVVRRLDRARGRA